MPGDEPRIGPWRLQLPAGATRLGQLHLARDDAGRWGWLRSLDPGLLGRPGATDRVLAAVRRLAPLQLEGVLTVLDLLAAGQSWYLVSAAVPAPAFLDMIGDLRAVEDPVLRAGLAGALLGDVGRACEALHTRGLVHGGLNASAVRIGDDGIARLLEPGVLLAADGAEPDPAADCRSWAGLARVLAGEPIDAEARAAILEAAAAAESAPAGTSRISAAREILERGGVHPEDVAARAFLRRRAGRDLPAAPAAASMTMTLPPAPAPGPAVDPMAVTRVSLAAGPAPAVTEVLPADPSQPTGLGPHLPGDEHGITGTPPWESSPPGRRSGSITPPVPAGRRRLRRGPASLAGLALVAAAATAAAWLLTHRGSDPTDSTPSRPLAVSGISIAAAPATAGCNSTVRITATLHTNGAGGPLRYTWTRSDGVVAGEQRSVLVPGQRDVAATLQWGLSGAGTLHGVATLTVLEPGGVAPAQAAFDYSCAG